MKNIARTFIILFVILISACSNQVSMDKFEIELSENYCAYDEGYVSIFKYTDDGNYHYKVICKNGIVKRFIIETANNP